MGTGAKLEELVRKSLKRQEAAGLWLLQTGPRFIGGVVGPGGEARGRVVARGGLDFHGDYKGLSLAFDAKSCANKTAFPLAQVEHHQAFIVRRAQERGAIAFFLLELTALGEYYALTWDVLGPYWKAKRAAEYGGGEARASIPFAEIQARCLRVERGRGGLDLVGCIEALAASSGAEAVRAPASIPVRAPKK